MATSFYEIKRIPDLTLSKYSALDENGVDGVLKKHLVFLRQIHRNALLNNETIHWIYEFNPSEDKGNRLKIFLKIDSQSNSSYESTWIENSPLAPYYDIVRVVPIEQVPGYIEYLRNTNDKLYKKYTDKGYDPKDPETFPKGIIMGLSRDNTYENMSVLIKREKFARADKVEYGSFYSVNKWEMNEDARLYNLFTMMQNVNQPCIYCVDLKPIDITNTIEEPEMLGSVMTALRNMLALRVEKNNNGMTSFQRDESANYTLERYKDLIKEIAANPHFQANIRVYANNKEYANMLLGAAASEALSEGSHDVKNYVGTYNIFEITNREVEYVHDDKAPSELKFWTTFFLLKEIAPFVVFPALYSGESIEKPKETAPSYDSTGLYLGRDNDGFDVYIPLKNLSKHAFLAGVPGSGKTNSMLHIATELYTKNIPFLILEPAKQEYRALVNRQEMKGITVFSPSSGTNFLLHINPFEFPTKMSLAEHIQNLINVFDGSFSMDPPMPFLLDRAIERVYRDKGWLPYMINNGSLSYPTMDELYKTLEKILDETDYEGEIKGNLKSVLQVRIGSLLSREMGDVFNVPFSTIAPEEWLNRSVVIELESMGSGPANFLTLMLSTLIRESLKVNPLTREEKKAKPVRHVIFFEEAHNLIGPKAEKEGGEGANPKIAATAFIVKMLAEVRALNEAIIIADQLPTAMAPEVIKNTSLKLGHRMTSADDRGLLGSTMSADDVQLERMATFTQGKTLAIYEGLLKPFELQMHQWSRIGDVVDDNLYTSPTNDSLYDALCYDDSPFLQDMKKSFDITCKKIDDIWDDIVDDIESFEENLDEAIEFSGDIEQSKKKLEITDWSQVPKDVREEVFRTVNESVEKQKLRISMLNKEFHSLCDRMEEVIFTLYAYKKQNRYFENDVKGFTTEKFLQYRDFCQDIKSKCEFERTQEQKERRTKLLKQWE